MRTKWIVGCALTLAAASAMSGASAAAQIRHASPPVLRLRSDVNTARAALAHLKLALDKDPADFSAPGFAAKIAGQVHVLVSPLEAEQAACLNPTIVADAGSAATSAALALTPLIYTSGLAYVGAQSPIAWRAWLGALNSAINVYNVRLAVLATDLGISVVAP